MVAAMRLLPVLVATDLPWQMNKERSHPDPIEISPDRQ